MAGLFPRPTGSAGRKLRRIAATGVVGLVASWLPGLIAGTSAQGTVVTSREFSVSHAATMAPGVAPPVGREISVIVTSPGAARPAPTVSRELSLANLTPVISAPVVPSRELSTYNDANPPVSLNGAHSREVAFAVTDSGSYAVRERASLEVGVLNWICTPCAVVNSDQAAVAYPVGGLLGQQIAALNAGPPAYPGPGWQAVHRRADDATDVAFLCAQEPSPLNRPYVVARFPLTERDEVTLDNCGSAFYRWTFDLPNPFTAPMLIGKANADDQGVVFLNGHRISGALTDAGCQPGPQPTDPCYDLQDTGHDRRGPDGRTILTRPTLDSFATGDSALFRPGTNELVIAVAGDASAYEPTGVEFELQVAFRSDLTGVGGTPGETPRPGLGAPTPNPTSGPLELQLRLDRPEPARLLLLDVTGRVVRTLLDAALPAGDHALQVDLREPVRLAAGIYFLRLSTPSRRDVRRLVVLGR